MRQLLDMYRDPEHVLICPAYAELREGKDIKNDRDLINYMQKVMIIRDKLKITK